MYVCYRTPVWVRDRPIRVDSYIRVIRVIRTGAIRVRAIRVRIDSH